MKKKSALETNFKTILKKALPYLPKSTLSRLIGDFAHVNIGHGTVEWFAKRYNLNMDEAEYPLEHYKTVGELFTRNLKPGARPIAEGVVHPADSRISMYGKIENGNLIQAKGVNYKLEDFLVSKEWAKTFLDGLFVTYYLCPTDYHHVHSPVEGEIIESHLVSGTLWPVNDWSANNTKNLFTVNERLVTYIKTPKGVCALVMVGASVVGKMTTTYDKSLIGNRGQGTVSKKYNGIKIKKGDRVGTFHLGSTVIMVYPKDFVKLSGSNIEGPVKLGQTLGT